jgi:hypoxanthine-DNA glycosylase
MSEYTHITHGFEPIFDEKSRILILGSVPSVKSRENNFYYGNPQNRFWRLIARLTESEMPQTSEEKAAMLKANGIALWDAVYECDIVGSGDASIKNVVPTDLSVIFGSCNIERIYANGAAAAKFYNKFQKPKYGKEITVLPSTSPANAAWSFDRLCEAWGQILN